MVSWLNIPFVPKYDVSGHQHGIKYETSTIIFYRTTPCFITYDVIVGAQSGPTHDRTSACDVRRSLMQHLLHWPVRVTGQTGSPELTNESDERSPGRDPIRAGTRRSVLGSAGHLERLQTSRRRRKNNGYGIGGARVWRIQKVLQNKEKYVLICFLIDWMSQLALALYIYRVGRTWLTRNSNTDLNLWKILNFTRTPRWIGQTSWIHQSDRWVMPNRL